MRTVFVNPRTRRKRRRKSATKRRRPRRRTTRRNATMANPRRTRRRRRTTPRRRRTYRRRRRNAGVTSFVQPNPLILSNPRRRRRRNPKPNLKKILNNTLVYMGGGALGYGVNQFGLSMIANDWVRRGAQIATAVTGAMFLKGDLGASFAGATMYPLMADLAMYTGLVAVPTSDDLDELSADLEAALEADLEDDELYIDDFEPMMDEELVAW